MSKSCPRGCDQLLVVLVSRVGSWRAWRVLPWNFWTSAISLAARDTRRPMQLDPKRDSAADLNVGLGMPHSASLAWGPATQLVKPFRVFQESHGLENTCNHACLLPPWRLTFKKPGLPLLPASMGERIMPLLTARLSALGIFSVWF
jgi:hypothetical protein